MRGLLRWWRPYRRSPKRRSRSILTRRTRGWPSPRSTAPPWHRAAASNLRPSLLAFSGGSLTPIPNLRTTHPPHSRLNAPSLTLPPRSSPTTPSNLPTILNLTNAPNQRLLPSTLRFPPTLLPSLLDKPISRLRVALLLTRNSTTHSSPFTPRPPPDMPSTIAPQRLPSLLPRYRWRLRRLYRGNERRAGGIAELESKLSLRRAGRGELEGN